MAGFFPASLDFTYQHNSTFVPNAPVSIEDYEFLPNSFRIEQVPDWLTVVMGEHEYNEEETRIVRGNFLVSVKQSFANNLPVGYHSADVKISGRVIVDPFNTKATFTLPVVIRVVSSTQLSISPTSFIFRHTIGQSAPAGKFFTVTTSRAWSVVANEGWVSFGQDNGVGEATNSVFVDVANLPVGYSTAEFLVDDGDSVKRGVVSVQVTGDVGDDYVNVTPSVLEFSETAGDAPQDDRTIDIDASENTTISANVPWLTFSQTSIPSGFNTVTVSTQNTEALQVGSYPAVITIEGADSNNIVDVLLLIVETPQQTIVNNGFYFAEDRNTIALSTARQQRCAIFKMIAQSATTYKNYERKVAFFRNVINEVVGLEASVFVVPQPLPDVLQTLVYESVVPVKLDISVFETSLYSQTAAKASVASFENVRFINGRLPETTNPTESKFKFVKQRLTKIPVESVVPVDGKVFISYRDASANDDINVSFQRDSAQQAYAIAVTPNLSNIYTAIIDLSIFNIDAGERVRIDFSIFTIYVTVHKPVLNTNQIIWTNEWDAPECFNINGPIEISEGSDTETIIKNKNGRDVEEVVSTKKPKTFAINTGNIYSQEEVAFLATILQSKKIWLQLDGERFEVIRDFNRIETQKTRTFVENLTLKFKSAIS